MDEDRKVRESYYKKDKDFNQKIRQEMEDEENMLKSYFKEYKKPTNEDPTVMRRQAKEMRIEAIKSAFSPFRVFTLFYEEYWNKEGTTAEEKYVLRLCKDYTKKQITKGMFISLAMTSLISYQMRMMVGIKFHLFSISLGLFSGFLYGAISSSQYTLQKFQSLGENYALGRSTIAEISKYRMDKQGV